MSSTECTSEPFCTPAIGVAAKPRNYKMRALNPLGFMVLVAGFAISSREAQNAASATAKEATAEAAAPQSASRLSIYTKENPPADRELAQAIMAQGQAPIINLAGRTTVSQLAGVLKRAAFAVTTDTGPMHLAAALGTPVVALFGPTAPWRTGPFGQGHEVVRLGMECSPCFLRVCPIDFRCMKRIESSEVIAAIRAKLSR